MSPELLFAVGTLALWAGLVVFGRAVFFGAKLASNLPGTNPEELRKRLLSNLGIAAALFVVSRVVPMDLGREFGDPGVHIPVVWFYSHFFGWLALVGLVGLIVNLIRSTLEIDPAVRLSRLKAAGGWLAVGIFGGWMFPRVGGQFVIFRGMFALNWGTIALIAVLAMSSIVLIAISARKATTRGWGKTAVTHLVLLVGCFVFGLPFAWLLSASFKEDRDILSGITWIPKITQRAEYMDPEKPQYEVEFEGQKVVAEPIETLPDGKLRLDVVQPMALRGRTVEATKAEVKEIPRMVPIAAATLEGQPVKGIVIKELEDGRRRLRLTEPASLAGQEREFAAGQAEDIRTPGLNGRNYPDALQYMPPETHNGWMFLQNTLVLVVLSVVGTLISCATVAYAFSRLRFPGRDFLFKVLLSTMMLPGAVTLMPQFLIFKQLGWIDTLFPLWVPAFFAGAFNVFLLRQFFSQIPKEFEDAAKIDGCGYLGTFWKVMLPQIKPALAVVAIWTFMGTWNNFMGPLIYINSPENMPISYALQLFNGERAGEPGLLMAFATMTILPVLALFFFAQKYFIEGVTLSGLGGR